MQTSAVQTGVWSRVALISLGGFFEFYDLFFTGYIAPGLVRSGILTPTTPGLFGSTGIAGFGRRSPAYTNSVYQSIC